MVNGAIEQGEAGFTLVELLIVISLISLLSIFVFVTAKDELHHIQVGAIAREFQAIANSQGMDTYYAVSLEVDDFNAARGSIGFIDESTSDEFFFTLQATIPSPGNMIQPYGVEVESVKDGDNIITHTSMTFYSKQEDPLVSLYLSDPYSSKKKSELK